MRESGLTGSCAVVSGSGPGFGIMAWEARASGAQSSFVASEHINNMSIHTQREWLYPFLGTQAQPAL